MNASFRISNLESSAGMRTSGGTMPSRSRKWFGIVTGTLLFLAALTIYVASGRGPREPVYKGVGLSVWLDGSKVPRGDLVRLKIRSEVLHSVGPEALPWLIHAFEIKNRNKWLSKSHQGYLRFYYTSPKARSFLPAPPIPRWETGRQSILLILARVAPGTPFEQRVLQDTLCAYDTGNNNMGQRDFAEARLRALGSFTNFPALVVPVLVASLTNAPTIDASIESLQHFGAFASGQLYRVAEKETGSIRPAELALKKVDRAAYDKLREEKNRF
jgi:hypothetical protein